MPERWCWQAVGEKDSTWCVGVAFDDVGSPLNGEITDDEGTIVELIAEGDHDLRLAARIAALPDLEQRLAEAEGRINALVSHIRHISNASVLSGWTASDWERQWARLRHMAERQETGGNDGSDG